MRLLISRLRAFRCEKIRDNLREHTGVGNVATIDNIGDLRSYTNDFLFSDFFKSKNPEMNTRRVTNIIDKYKITHALIAQALHPCAEATAEACRNLGVKFLWAEAFFDNKLILDYTGLQYLEENDISKWGRLHQGTNIELPQSTRQPQPNDLTLHQFKRKYKIAKKDLDRCVVIIGQVVWDMALKKSKIAEKGIDYEQFLRNLVENNKDLIFLFKPHPQCPIERTPYMKFYDNVIIINESLETMFRCFDYYVAYSSTVIFEGMARGKKFLTAGYHLMSGLTPQIENIWDFCNILDRIKSFNFNQEAITKRISFITTQYAIDMSKERFLEKITLKPEQFYKKG